MCFGEWKGRFFFYLKCFAILLDINGECAKKYAHICEILALMSNHWCMPVAVEHGIIQSGLKALLQYPFYQNASPQIAQMYYLIITILYSSNLPSRPYIPHKNTPLVWTKFTFIKTLIGLLWFFFTLTYKPKD